MTGSASHLERAADDALKELGAGGRVTVLTGAGVSAESGLATFRDAGGLWEQYDLEDVATPQAFARNPRLVQELYNARRRNLHTVAPNPAHEAIARLEAVFGDRFTLITQNVDDLHERGGSRRVLHMHGELLKARCVGCGHAMAWPGDIRPQDACPRCKEGLRPHVVWFGEMPFYLDVEIPRALEAEVFVSIGTSGSVYPAAGMVAEVRARGGLTVELNLDTSDNFHLFEHRVLGPAGKLVPDFVKRLAAGV